MFERLIRFFRPKWEEYLVTQDTAYYMQVKGRLIDQGILHKTKISCRQGRRNIGLRDAVTYTLFIKKISPDHKQPY